MLYRTIHNQLNSNNHFDIRIDRGPLCNVRDFVPPVFLSSLPMTRALYRLSSQMLSFINSKTDVFFAHYYFIIFILQNSITYTDLLLHVNVRLTILVNIHNMQSILTFVFIIFFYKLFEPVNIRVLNNFIHNKEDGRIFVFKTNNKNFVNRLLKQA